MAVPKIVHAKLAKLLVAVSIFMGLAACGNNAPTQGSLTANVQLPPIGSLNNPAVMDMANPRRILYSDDFYDYICVAGHEYLHVHRSLTPLFDDEDHILDCPRQ